MAMNTKFLPLCVSLCTCLMAASASAAPFISSHGYSLTPASGWRVNPSHSPDDDVVIEHRQDAAAAGKPNFQVDVTALGGHVTLETLKPVVISDYQKKFPGLVTKSQTFSFLGGVRDLDLVFTQTRSGIPLRLHQVYVLKNGLAYIFTAAYPEKTHTKYDGAVAQMLASVRWKS